MTSIEERLTALESLFQELFVGELIPNYLSIDPTTGQVGASFTGQVNAQGLTLIADESGFAPPPPVSSVEWVRASNGAVIALVQGSYAPGADSAACDINAYAQSATGNSDVQIAAQDDGGNSKAFLRLLQSARGASASIDLFSNGPGVLRLIDQAGNSDWPRNATGSQKILFSYNGGTFTWPGSSQLTNVITFNTGFTVGPGGFVTGAQSVAGGLVQPVCTIGGWTTNTVKAQLWTNGSPGAGTQANAWVLAWGT